MVEVPAEGCRDGQQVANRHLEVVWMCSGEVACVVEITPSVTIADLRSQVMKSTGVPAEQQKLFSEGRELLLKQIVVSTMVGARGPDTKVPDMKCPAMIQLVRCHSDPRNTNRGFFRENLQLPEKVVGNFRRVRKIGNAIYGEVSRYQWIKETETEDVAVKCISVQKARQSLEKDTNEWTAHQSSHNIPNPEDAYAEIGVLQYLAKQPDLPAYLSKLLAAFVEDSKIWLVMELADGELLDAVLSQKVVDASQTRRYLWQTLQAVKYLHAHYIGHRDISLENLLLKDGDIRLVDFGNAVQSHSSSGQELRYFLTVGKDTYRAPECIVPHRASVPVMVPDDASAEDIIMHRESSGLYQVRLPKSAVRGTFCQAEVWGYAAQPADIFSCGVCFFCMSYGNGPWIQAQLTDEFFAYVIDHHDGLKDLLRHWGKPLLETEAMDLLLDMIRIDPLRRPAASSCLESNWFRDQHGDIEMLPA
mgnify:FL=1